jgi:hypothetical protein
VAGSPASLICAGSYEAFDNSSAFNFKLLLQIFFPTTIFDYIGVQLQNFSLICQDRRPPENADNDWLKMALKWSN